MSHPFSSIPSIPFEQLTPDDQSIIQTLCLAFAESIEKAVHATMHAHVISHDSSHGSSHSSSHDSSHASSLSSSPSLHLAVACSGGRDSMVLATILGRYWARCKATLTLSDWWLNHAKWHLCILTVNHHLHELADTHAQAVQDHWSPHIPCFILHADPNIIAQGAGIEEGARRARYQAFQHAIQTHKIDYILTAHHLFDQVETLIMRLQNASGIQGMSGIPTHRDYIIRPWLAIHPQWIERMADVLHVPIFEDPSNQQQRFLRNRIRSHVLPALQKSLSSQWALGFHHSAQNITEQWQGAQHLITHYINKHCQTYSYKISLDWAEGLDIPITTQKLILFYLWREALMLWAPQATDMRRIKEHLPRLLELFQSSRYQMMGLPYTIRAWGGKGQMRLYAMQHASPIPQHSIILDDWHQSIQNLCISSQWRDELNAKLNTQSEIQSKTQLKKQSTIYHNDNPNHSLPTFILQQIEWGEWICTIKLTVKPISTPQALHTKDLESTVTHHAESGIDWRAIQTPCRLRMPYQGERFRPAGNRGSKKIKKIWSDLHCPVIERDTLPVLADAHDQVIYLPFSRISHDLKQASDQIQNSMSHDLPHEPADHSFLPSNLALRIHFDWNESQVICQGLPSMNQINISLNRGQ